ncbi:MAG: hypothetical protein KBT22_09130 [Bacteroidales bacterium]|nr:hypothetical protein [Candidatus Scybalocola fimicaballi]
MNRNLYILAFLLSSFTNILAETPVFQPKSIKEIDFEKSSKLFDSAIKKLSDYKDKVVFTKEEALVLDETKESFWQVHGGGCSWYCGGGPSSVEASSCLKSNGEINYEGKNAHDLNYKNAWVEGVKGYGIGEYLKYKFDVYAPRITEIIVVNGYVKSQSAFQNNSRVKRLKVYYNNKAVAILELKDIMGEQRFKIGTLGNYRNVETGEFDSNASDWELKFEILDVYKGDKYDDTAISEIYFDGIDVH